MSALSNIGALLQDPAFQARFEDLVSGNARRHHTFLAYVDEQGRMVREYPATGEIFQPSADRRTMRLLSKHGEVVEDSPWIEATPYRSLE